MQLLTLCGICLCLTASGWQQEACANSDRPVPSVSGVPDENPDCVPAIFHTLHQTKRLQEAHGEENEAAFTQIKACLYL